MQQNPPDKVIVAFMKAIVNSESGLTEKDESDLLDTVFTMLKKRRAQKRMAEIKRVMRRHD